MTEYEYAGEFICCKPYTVFRRPADGNGPYEEFDKTGKRWIESEEARDAFRGEFGYWTCSEREARDFLEKQGYTE